MAGVFVNYRSIDQPLGAAGIHSALASRFGLDNVFHDCVLPDVGIEGRVGVWDALATADVLVVVMGPRWLTIADDDGIRLVDRARDWVRREIAWALERRLDIVPVLLRDTPEHALAPTPDQLPADIRGFGALPALEFSQRRFPEDVERLVRTLVEVAPALTPAKPARGPKPQVPAPEQVHQDLPYQAYMALVDAVGAVPTMLNEDTRSLVVLRLRPTISGAIRHFPARRAHVMSIVRTCLDHDGGLADLLTVVRDIEGDSLAWKRLAEVADRHVPGWDGHARP
jgi:Effector-associated domain 2